MAETVDAGESKAEGVSDMDWFKRHTKPTLETESAEKAFEQSEDEGEEQQEVNETVCVFIVHSFSFTATHTFTIRMVVSGHRTILSKPRYWKHLDYSCVILPFRVQKKSY